MEAGYLSQNIPALILFDDCKTTTCATIKKYEERI